MALTPRETQDMITLQRQVAWQYDLDNFTNVELKKIQRSVNLARNDIGAHFARRGADIGAWTRERLDDSLNELQAMTIGIQGELTDDISDLYAQAGSQAFAAQANMLSFGGRVPGMNFVALAPAQLKAMASEIAVGGQLLNSWVDRSMGMVLQEQLRTEVLAGMLKGEGYAQFVKRLEGKFTQFSERELTTLARTYVQEANVRAQTSIYKANPDIVDKVKWSAALEPGSIKTGRGTCPRCAALDGQKFDMDMHPLCPLHPRCRCLLLPVTKSYRELGLDIDEIEANYRPYTIRNNANIDAGGKRKIIEVGFHKGDYGSWFNKQSQSFKRNVVGPKRLELLNTGKVKFNQLVSSSSGRLYNLDELAWFNEVGFPDNTAKYAGMSKVEKIALKTRLIDKGPYPDLPSLDVLTGQEVKMLASGLDLPTFGRTRTLISEDIVTYYKGKIVKPPITPPGPITPLPTPGIVTTQAQLDAMSWTELRKFGSNLGITGKHPRPEWNRLILEKIGDTPKLPVTPKPIPIPTPGAVDYKALSWSEVRAYGKQLGISGKYKRPELEDMIAAALKKGADPVDVKVIISKADNVVVAEMTPQDKLIRQKAEFDEFFKDRPPANMDWKVVSKNMKIPYEEMSDLEKEMFTNAAPAFAQHQRLFEAKVNYMRWLKETDYDAWVVARRAVVKKQVQWGYSGYVEAITDVKLQNELIDITLRGTTHIDDGLFLELERANFRMEWVSQHVKSDNRAGFYAGRNKIRLFAGKNDFEVVGHEYGHAVDHFFTGRGSVRNWDTDAGDIWQNNQIVSQADGLEYRSYYNKQKTGTIGKYSNGDGYYHKGNWIADYEGRIYELPKNKVANTVGEQFWAMGSQRYTKYDDLLRSGQWEKMTDGDKWASLRDMAFKKQNAAAMIGDNVAAAKWGEIRIEYLKKSNISKQQGTKFKFPKDAKDNWAAANSDWDKQRTFYPEFAEMQERIYKTEWALKNDPIWERVLKEEAAYNKKYGLKVIAKADTAALDMTVDTTEDVVWQAELPEAKINQWAQGTYKDKVFYHTTSPEFMKDIRKTGFDVASEEGMAYKVFGEGGYFSTDKFTAAIYQDLLEDADFQTFRFKVNVKNPKVIKRIPDDINTHPKLVDHIAREVNANDYDDFISDGLAPNKALEKVLREAGYDSLQIDIPHTHPNFKNIGGNQLLVFDKKNIVAVKGGGKVDLAAFTDKPKVKLPPPKTVTTGSALKSETEKLKLLMSDEQVRVLNDGNMVGSAKWNKLLRDGTPIKDWPKALSAEFEEFKKALSELPKLDGTSYRGLSFLNKKDYDSFLKQFDGDVYVDKGLMSSSYSKEVAESFAEWTPAFKDEAIMIKIKGRTGRNISPFSGSAETRAELEVMFGDNTRFRIVSKTQTKNGLLIEMEELKPGEVVVPKVIPVDNKHPLIKKIRARTGIEFIEGTDSSADFLTSSLAKTKKYIKTATVDSNKMQWSKSLDDYLSMKDNADFAPYINMPKNELLKEVANAKIAKIDGKYVLQSNNTSAQVAMLRDDITDIKFTNVWDYDEFVKVKAKTAVKIVDKSNVSYSDFEELEKLMAGLSNDAPLQFVADIRRYIDSEDVYLWNTVLRKKMPLTEWKIYSKDLDKRYTEFKRSLDQLPTYEGTSYRGIRVSRNVSDEFMSKIEKGGIYIDEGFSSSSVKREVAENFAASPGQDSILFTIEGKSGKAISKFSSNSKFRKEGEVLFGPGKKFEILSKKKTDFGWEVSLKEVDDLVKRKVVVKPKVVQPKVVQPKVVQPLTGGQIEKAITEMEKAGGVPAREFTEYEQIMKERVRMDQQLPTKAKLYVTEVRDIDTNNLIFIDHPQQLSDIRLAMKMGSEELLDSIDQNHLFYKMPDGKYLVADGAYAEAVAAWKRPDILTIRARVVDPSLSTRKVIKPLKDMSDKVYTDANKLHNEMTKIAKTADEAEMSLVNRYAGEHSGEVWNSFLRGDVPEWGKDLTREFDEFMDFHQRLPRYKGVSYRGLSFDEEDTANAFLKELEPGKVWVDKGLMSSSSSKATAINFMDNIELDDFDDFEVQNIMLKINGRNGRPISEFARGYDESEILFRPGSKFVVKSKTFDDGVWKIEIDELDDIPAAKVAKVPKTPDLTSPKWVLKPEEVHAQAVFNELEKLPDMKGIKVGKVWGDDDLGYRTIMISDEVAGNVPQTIPGGKDHTGIALRVFNNGDLMVDEITSGRPGFGQKMIQAVLDGSPADSKLRVHVDMSGGWWDKIANKYPGRIIWETEEGFGTAKRGLKKAAKQVDVPKGAPVKAKKVKVFTDAAQGEEFTQEWRVDMPQKDMNTLQQYVEGNEVYKWNKAFRAGKPPTSKGFKEFSAAFETLPEYDGTSYRGISFESPEEAKKFMKQFKEGNLYEDKGFMSTSWDKDVADEFRTEFGEGFYEGNLTLEVRGKKGKFISAFSSDEATQYEAEILFGPNSKFRVAKITGSPSKGWTVVLDEVEELDVPKGAAPKGAAPAKTGLYTPDYVPSVEVKRTIDLLPEQHRKVVYKFDTSQVRVPVKADVGGIDIPLSQKDLAKYRKMKDVTLLKETENLSVVKVGDDYIYPQAHGREAMIAAKERGLEIKIKVYDHDAYLKKKPIVPLLDRSDEVFTSYNKLAADMVKVEKTMEAVDKIPLWDFVQGFDTKDWNAALRKGIQPPKLDKMNIAISKMESLPKYQGKSYRGIEFKNKKLAAEFVDSIDEGGIYVDEAFLSSSADQAKVATDFVKNPVIFEIEGKAGRSVSQFADEFAFEKEIVFTPNSKFHVVSKTFDKPSKTWIIKMEELEDRGKGAAPAKKVVKGVDVDETMKNLKANKYNIYDPTDNEMEAMFKFQDKLEDGKKVKSVAVEVSPDDIVVPKNVLLGSSENEIKRWLKADANELAAFADDPELLFARLPNGKYFSIGDEDAFIALAQRSDIDKVKIHVVNIKGGASKPKKLIELKPVYTDPAEMNKAMKKYVKDLDEETIENVGQYIDNPDSYEWNVAFRADAKPKTWSPRMRKDYGAFTKTFDTLPTYQGVSYRGVELVEEAAERLVKDLDVGHVYVDKGLMSTSLKRDIAESFGGITSKKGSGVLFKINGKSGKPISAFSVGDAADFEHEILFRPNTKYVITSKTKVKGKWLIEMDELEPKAVAKKAEKTVKAAPDVGKQQTDARKMPIDPKENYVRDGDVFKYKGEVVQGEVAERLKAMKLPPSWTDVVISTDPDARLQAAGIAKNGKVQPRYAAWHIKEKAIEKFNRQRLFSSDVGSIRGKMEADILKGDPRAMLLKIEDETVIRIGTDTDLNAKQKAYGLTTLQHEHVKVAGNKITFDFVAKEGINAHYEITDARLANWLQERIDKTLPGEKLFPDVPAGTLNKYLKDLADGKKYSIKDYRTFHATRIAYEELQQYVGKTLTDVERKRIIKEVSTAASDFLHNNPDMAKKSYIDPMVWELIGGE